MDNLDEGQMIQFPTSPRSRLPMDPNAKIKAALADYRMTQGDFASAAKIAQSRLNDILHGKAVTHRLAVPIVRFLQVAHPGATVDWLYDDRLSWPPPPPSTTPGIILSVEERELVALMRTLGIEVSRRRLLRLPDPIEPQPSPGPVEVVPSHVEPSAPAAGPARKGNGPSGKTVRGK